MVYSEIKNLKMKIGPQKKIVMLCKRSSIIKKVAKEILGESNGYCWQLRKVGVRWACTKTFKEKRTHFRNQKKDKNEENLSKYILANV